MPTRPARRARRLLTAALVATTVGLFAATGMLYNAQIEQRELLANSLDASNRAGYQAQLEFSRAAAARELVLARPTRAAIDRLKLQLELLAQRLSALRAATGEQAVHGRSSGAEALLRHEAGIDEYRSAIEAAAADPDRMRTELGRWQTALEPLGHDLETFVEASARRHDEVQKREQLLARGPVALALSLMFLSGAGLVVVLALQAGQARRRLNEILGARRAVAESNSNFRAAIEAMPAAIVIFDPRTRGVSFVNPAASALVDPSPNHPEWQRLIRAATKNAAAASTAVNIAFARANGAIISLSGSLCDIQWEGRSHRLLAVTDISKIRDAELQLMQSSKLATLGEMATAIAHETNQPLAVIKMAVANARRLISAGVIGDALLAKLARIDGQVDRVKTITDQIRRYGRPASRQREQFPVQEAITLAIGFVAEQYRASGIRLEIDLDIPSNVTIAGEQTMFEQVIVNILVNARDAFADADLGSRSPAVWVRCRAQDEELLLTVEDNAGGIRPDMLSRLFEPFRTTKPAGTGTGLGLSISRNVLRDMNGDIEAENVALGARFRIRLPVARQPKLNREAA